MTGYVLRRLLLMIPTLIGILLVSFVIIQFVLGGPVEQLVQQLRGGGIGGEVASTGGVYRTDDGGGSWVPLPTQPSGVDWLRSIAVDPADPSRIYAGGIGFGSSPTIARSLDGGGTWTTVQGGNSTAPPPPGDIPSYMGVVVTSNTTKSGNTTSGNIVSIIVVQTDAGYSPEPGHPGTGTVVATYCP